MFINTATKNEKTASFSLFDTVTGIEYSLRVDPNFSLKDYRIVLNVTSVHNSNPDTGLSYNGKTALIFWEKLKDHPSIETTPIERWLADTGAKVEELLD